MSDRRAVLLHLGDAGRSRDGDALAAALEARGFGVELLDAPRAALEALARGADVLIVDADAASLELREFVESLRQDTRAGAALVVALVAGDPRDLPARREIALALARPINADEVASRLEGLVETRQRATVNPRELRGDLGQLPLPDLLQLLAVSRASGALAIDASGRQASLALVNGELHDVVFGAAAGLKAFVRMLQLPGGAFVFTHGAPEATDGGDGGEALALGPALFEATRQLDEIGRIRPTLPQAWAEVRRAGGALPGALAARAASEPALAEVDRLLATPRTLGALLDASPLPDADLLAAFDALRAAGLVEVAGSAPDERVEVLDPPRAAALASRLAAHGRAQARVLVVVDGGPAAAAAPIARALGSFAGFEPAEGALSGAVWLGALGALLVNDARVELYAVPAEREFFPVWAVVAASADAAVIATDVHDGGRGERVLHAELGLPVATVAGMVNARSVAEALRAALERVSPRR